MYAMGFGEGGGGILLTLINFNSSILDEWSCAQ